MHNIFPVFLCEIVVIVFVCEIVVIVFVCEIVVIVFVCEIVQWLALQGHEFKFTWAPSTRALGHIFNTIIIFLVNPALLNHLFQSMYNSYQIDHWFILAHTIVRPYIANY